jgi:hypothetical protein
MGYEINQLFVAETFQQLYADGRGRSRLSREEMQARQELCKDIAQSLSEVCLGLRFKVDASASEALARCYEGLLTPPSSLPAAEARWVVIRFAELLQWDAPNSLRVEARPDSCG